MSTWNSAFIHYAHGPDPCKFDYQRNGHRPTTTDWSKVTCEYCLKRHQESGLAGALWRAWT